MFLTRFTIRNQLVLVIIIGAKLSLPTMAYVMIRMHSNFAEHQFILRHDRLTTLMASEMAAADWGDVYYCQMTNFDKIKLEGEKEIITCSISLKTLPMHRKTPPSKK